MKVALAALLALPTAGASYSDDSAVLKEINYLRAGPATYAVELGRIATGYDGRYYVEADGTPHASIEGAGAVRAAEAALEHEPAEPALRSDPVLRAAARDHVEEQGRGLGIGHAGLAGDTPSDRVRRHGGDIYVSEVISYGMHDAADVVRQLVVDDGMASRGHRRLLLSPLFRYAGIWCGPHAGQGTMCVVDMAANPGGRPTVPGDRAAR